MNPSVRSASSSTPLLPSLFRPHRHTRRILNPSLCTINNVPTRIPQRRPFSFPPHTNTQNPSSRLTGRTCMITGGTSGIGFAIASQFLQEGASRIILVGRSYERLLKAASKLQGPEQPNTATSQSSQDRNDDIVQSQEPGTLVHSSDKIDLLVGDVSDAGSWFRELEKAMQPVDILINAAGISNSNILPKITPTEISQTLRTNLEGAILTSRALLRSSLRNRLKDRTGDTRPASKCIINISSLLALKGGNGAVPYAASKAGLLGLTRSLAVEAGVSLRGVAIRSNAIVPGYIETPMIAGFSEGENEKLKGLIPLGRFGVPEEVADAAVFLAGNEFDEDDK
ncbi:hypothetical protein BBP40_009274 [Aspergillus hancockii]|nr:hypothetical protein BBP40_009274 [Aspergillus hancockii]